MRKGRGLGQISQYFLDQNKDLTYKVLCWNKLHIEVSAELWHIKSLNSKMNSPKENNHKYYLVEKETGHVIHIFTKEKGQAMILFQAWILTINLVFIRILFLPWAIVTFEVILYIIRHFYAWRTETLQLMYPIEFPSRMK